MMVISSPAGASVLSDTVAASSDTLNTKISPASTSTTASATVNLPLSPAEKPTSRPGSEAQAIASLCNWIS